MTEIIPAILPKNFTELREKLELMSSLVRIVHIDALDGTLGSEKTWPYAGESDLVSHEELEELRHFGDLHFEAHLMTNDPMSIIGEWVGAGAERITIHVESFENDDVLEDALRTIRGHFEKEKAFEAPQIGLALNFDTSFERVRKHVGNFDFLHLMSIRRIGAQGHPFESGILEKIGEIKGEFSDMIISVDGGVSIENAEALAEAGAERLIVGSAIFNAEDPQARVEELIEKVSY